MSALLAPTAVDIDNARARALLARERLEQAYREHDAASAACRAAWQEYHAVAATCDRRGATSRQIFVCRLRIHHTSPCDWHDMGAVPLKETP